MFPIFKIFLKLETAWNLDRDKDDLFLGNFVVGNDPQPAVNLYHPYLRYKGMPFAKYHDKLPLQYLKPLVTFYLEKWRH